MATTRDNIYECYCQSLYFLLSDYYKTFPFDTSSAANVHLSLWNQLKVAKISSSDESSDEILLGEHLLEYNSLIDNDKDLNNCAEAILSTSDHERSECDHWKSSFESATDEELAQLFSANPRIQAEPSDDDIQYFIKEHHNVAELDKIPLKMPTYENLPDSYLSFLQVARDSSSLLQHINGGSKSLSENKSNDIGLQKCPFKLNKEQNWDVQSQLQNFSNADASSSIMRSVLTHKQGSERSSCNSNDYGNGKFVAFSTAREQLVIDQQKKYGRGSAGGGSLSSAEYGISRKCLGTRRGLNSKFNPPVINKNPEDLDDGLPMSRSGSSRPTITKNGVLDERLKNIDSRMVELMENEIMDHGSPITWDDIAGLEFAKTTIQEIVVWPLLRPDIFTGLRGPPKGILLFGPPGTGKTLIGKCIASQSKSTFFCISASSLTSKWVGEGEKMVRALFAVARCHQPAVIFIDEIDSLLSQRSDTEHESTRRIKTEFLVQFDGAATASDERLLIVGATNRPQELDEAARRRLVKRLYIDLPDAPARKQIVKILVTSHNNSLTEEDFDIICQNTEGYSGADMANLCKEASLGPIRSLDSAAIEYISPDQVRPIILQDFLDALKQVRASVSEKDLCIYLEWNKRYGSTSLKLTS